MFFTIPGIIILLPLFCVISFWIKIDSPGPIFFRQIRVGLYGKQFHIYKFRTMIKNAEVQGSQLTVGEDQRITLSGKYLRKYKLDELPQLLNVLLGEMSLVGPRPEVPQYMNNYPEEIKNVILSVLPGITDYASIYFKDENRLLGQSVDPEKTYLEVIIPIKQTYYLQYVREHSTWGDLCLIIGTLRSLIWKGSTNVTTHKNF